jgi:type IX secretion system PorP/SprF family membrane protein
MNRQKLIIILWFIITGIQASAQHDFEFNQYMFHQQVYNPAATGLTHDMGAFIYGEKNFKWDVASVYKASAYHAINKYNMFSGLHFSQYKLGMEKKMHMLGDIGYRFITSSDETISVGLKSGVVHYNNKLSQYALYPDGIPDPVFANDINDYYWLIGLGVHYSSERLQAGISSPQLALLKIKNNSDYDLNTPPQVYFFGTYKFLLNEKFNLQPGILLNVYDDELRYLPSVHLQHFEKFRLGGSYDFNRYIILFSRWVFNNGIGIGYTYNIVTSVSKMNRHSLSLSVDMRAKGRGQRAEGREQRAEGREHRAQGKGHRAESREQRAKSEGQRAKRRLRDWATERKEKRAECTGHWAGSTGQRAQGREQRAESREQRAESKGQRAKGTGQRAKRRLRDWATERKEQRAQS